MVNRATGIFQRQHAVSSYSYHSGEKLDSLISRGRSFYTYLKRENTSEKEAKIIVKVIQFYKSSTGRGFGLNQPRRTVSMEASPAFLEQLWESGLLEGEVAHRLAHSHTWFPATSVALGSCGIPKR